MNKEDAKKCRFELLTMVDTILEVRLVSMSDYLKYFEDVSPMLHTRVKNFASCFPAWDVLNMCLNYVGWSNKDYDVLINVTNKFMNDCRRSVMEKKDENRDE